jgi:hypothetical protein
MSHITLPDNYQYCLLAVVGISLECFATGFSTMGIRKRVFNKEFMQ